MGYPEGQDWQTTCRECGKAKCPKPERVAQWLRALLTRTHKKHLQAMKGADWRFLVAASEGYMDAALSTWAHALEGTCPDCMAVKAPEESARFEEGEAPNVDAWNRWVALVPMDERAPSP